MCKLKGRRRDKKGIKRRASRIVGTVIESIVISRGVKYVTFSRVRGHSGTSITLLQLIIVVGRGPRVRARVQSTSKLITHETAEIVYGLSDSYIPTLVRPSSSPPSALLLRGAGENLHVNLHYNNNSGRNTPLQYYLNAICRIMEPHHHSPSIRGIRIETIDCRTAFLGYQHRNPEMVT